MQDGILSALPEADILLSVVWTPMLPDDSRDAAVRASAMFDDARMRQYYDPERLAGRAVAASLGGDDHVAWDIYLFYAPGRRWDAAQSQPVAWAHQLGTQAWADASRYQTGAALVEALRRETARQIA